MEENRHNDLRHVVMFRFKEHVEEKNVKKVEDDFAALQQKISLIKAFEYGLNVSKEGLDQGYTHCFLLTFESESDRDAYIVHPVHQEFVSSIGDFVDAAFVIDYWNR